MKFQKGQSGNPGGRPKGYREFRDQLREFSPAIVKRLQQIANGTDDKLAIDAGKVLLEHAWGRPAQAVTGEGGEGPVQIMVVSGVPRDEPAED